MRAFKVEKEKKIIGKKRRKEKYWILVF